MSVVYKVRHLELNTVHALKVVNLPLPGLDQRLLAEGRALGALRHRHVLSVTDVVSVEGVRGLVLELVEGPDLSELLRHRRLSVDEVDELGRQLLAGVIAAHAHPMVHRDLKPGNVLLDLTAANPCVKIADFGLVKGPDRVDLGPDRTRTGAQMGTPGYMAPEQIEDASAADHRADLFAVGVILYEMLTDQRPFVGDSVFEVLRATHDGAFLDVLSQAPGAPGRMVAAIEAALRVDVAWRVDTAEGLLALWCDETPAPSVTWGSFPMPQAPMETSWSEGRRADGARSTQAEPGNAADWGDPTAVGWRDHPPLERLVHEASDPAIAAHLAECASCRVERRLYEDAAGASGDGPRDGLTVLGAILVAVPFTVGLLVVLFDGVEAIEMMGPFGWAVALVTVLGLGWTVRSSLRARRGLSPSVLGWFLAPALVVVFGLFGSALGNQVVKSVVDLLGASQRGVMAAQGVWVALSTESAGYTLGAVLLLAVMVGACGRAGRAGGAGSGWPWAPSL